MGRCRIPRASALAAAVASVPFVPGVTRADEPPTFADRELSSVEGPDHAFAWLVSPLAMAFGSLGVEADVVVAPGLAVRLGLGAVRLRSGAWGGETGAGVVGYPWRNVLHGAWWTLDTDIAWPLREPLSALELREATVDVDGLAGWQWTWDYGFTVRAGAGARLTLGTGARSAAPELVLAGSRVGVLADASVGWAF